MAVRWQCSCALSCYQVRRVCHVYCHISDHIKKGKAQVSISSTQRQSVKNVSYACGQFPPEKIGKKISKSTSKHASRISANLDTLLNNTPKHRCRQCRISLCRYKSVSIRQHSDIRKHNKMFNLRMGFGNTLSYEKPTAIYIDRVRSLCHFYATHHGACGFHQFFPQFERWATEPILAMPILAMPARAPHNHMDVDCIDLFFPLLLCWLVDRHSSQGGRRRSWWKRWG